MLNSNNTTTILMFIAITASKTITSVREINIVIGLVLNNLYVSCISKKCFTRTTNVVILHINIRIIFYIIKSVISYLGVKLKEHFFPIKLGCMEKKLN